MPTPLPTLPDGYIYDYIDKKKRKDTPEEYVRQNIERRLVLELGFKREQIEIEFSVKIGSSRRRADIVIFKEGAPHDQDNVWIIIECKRDNVQPTAKKDGVDQLKSYVSACVNAEWGMWTNGRYKAVYRRIPGQTAFQEPNDIPSANGDPEEVDRPKRGQLKRAANDNLLFSFKICHNHIYTTDGLQKQPAFFELLKVIFCKIFDERDVTQPLRFYATANEKASVDGRLTVQTRIGKIFDKVKKKYPAIFGATEKIKLQPRSLAYIVGELQRYSFLKTDIDVKGKAYEELVGATNRGDRGEFFTPRNVQRMAVNMLDLKAAAEEKVLDPSCGTGGFLVICMNEIIIQVRAAAQQQGLSGQALQTAVDDKIKEIAGASFYGIDINPDLVKATKMNMVMNNDGEGNIMRQDSLLHPHEWESGFKKKLATALGIETSSLRGPDDLAQFDVIATNPPFGSKLPVKDRNTLGQYELARVWREDDDGVLVPTDDYQTSVPPEILFIERCWQFLRPGGRMAIVLPKSILGAPKLAYVRQWMLNTCRLIASVDLHPDTFQPHNSAKTAVLFLQRKDEGHQGLGDYEIFMGQNFAMGRTRREQPVYIRNEDGEEVLFDPEVTELRHTADGDAAVREMPKEKRLDDDTGAIATKFLAWKQQAVLGW